MELAGVFKQELGLVSVHFLENDNVFGVGLFIMLARVLLY